MKSALLTRLAQNGNLAACSLAFWSGSLLALGFAPLRLWWLAWIALVPLYIGLGRASEFGLRASEERSSAFGRGQASPLRNRLVRRGEACPRPNADGCPLPTKPEARTPKPSLDPAWGVGFSFGLGLFLVGMYWMTEVGFWAWPVLSAIQALPFAVFGAICVWLWRPLPSWARPLIFAALWVVLEWARTQGRYAFPWFPLAATQVEALPLLQILSVTGQWGLSFAIAFCGGLLGEAWEGRSATRSGTIARVAAALSIVGLLAAFGYLYLQFSRLSENDSDMRYLNVGVAQGCYPSAAENQLDVYLDLSRQMVISGNSGRGETPDVILWPETASPQDIVHSAPTREALAAFARSTKTSLLVGNEIIDGKGRFNSAILVNPDGNVSGRYDKIQLVPMGEFFILRPLLRAVTDRYVPEDDMVPGDKPGVVTVRRKLYDQEKVSVGVIICYESAFPARVRATVRTGAQCIALITNDETFGTTAGPYQHADFAVLRAVENGIYLVRAAHTGTSRLIDPNGRIVKSVPLMQRGVLTGRIVLGWGNTVYAFAGEWFVVVCGMIVLTAGIVRVRKALKSASEPSSRPD